MLLTPLRQGGIEGGLTENRNRKDEAMKLVSYRLKSEVRGGIVLGEQILDMEKVLGKGGARTVLELLQGGPSAMTALKKALAALTPAKAKRAEVGPVSKVKLEAPVPRPGKILALAGNYAEHIKEGGKTFKVKDTITPRIFIKPATGVIGHETPIPYPKVAQFIDWEGELGVIIGKPAKYFPREKAMQYVAGYTIVHDVSERRLKIRERKDSSEWDKFFDWLNGKWFDGFAPMGPWMVTKDEIRDVGNLAVETRVNGKVEQSGNTGQMIFDVADLIHYASHIFTLEPGDVIATGTPAGVGHGKNVKLNPGDVVEIEIEKIGTLRNAFKAEGRK